MVMVLQLVHHLALSNSPFSIIILIKYSVVSIANSGLVLFLTVDCMRDWTKYQADLCVNVMGKTRNSFYST